MVIFRNVYYLLIKQKLMMHRLAKIKLMRGPEIRIQRGAMSGIDLNTV